VETGGEFLWPKQRRADGKTFGFDAKELARKKAKYLDVTQFYAQYYNNPNAVETQLIDRSRFNYYERDKIENFSGAWYFGDKLLHIYAAMDFAYSIGTNSDYTVIMVVGVDEDNNFYVLDIDRFKTNKISVMYDKAELIYRKWKFKKMRCEVVAAQRLIVGQFKDYMRSQNIVFTIDEYNPPKNMRKAERIATILEPRYNNNQIWHYKGGNCQTLEEELMMNNPEHDDIKDALASCIEICKAPMSNRTWGKRTNVVAFNSKYGGVSY
jgi:phage terminase large subunit-like protein